MASSTSSSSAYSSALSGLRMSGTSLLSGLDTESIVKQMASATKNKINKQQQALDLLTWKQDAYRSVITKINTFKSSYFDSLNPKSNLASNSLMGAYKAVSSNSKVTATAASNASVTSYSITDFTQAKSAAATSDFGTGSISSGLKLDFPGTAGTNYTVKVTLDGAAKEITFDGTQSGFLTALNNTVTGFGAAGTFTVTDGVLDYAPSAADGISHTFSILASGNSSMDSDDKYAALTALGIPDGGSNKISLSSTLGSINFSTNLVGGSFTFSVNGKEFTFDRSATVREIINTVNKSDAGVVMSFDSLSQKFSVKASTEGAGGSVELSQSGGNLLNVLLGTPKDADGNSITFTEGGSLSSSILMSKSLTGTALTSTSFNTHMDSTFEVTVNGETKTIGLWTYDQNGSKNSFDDTTDSSGNTTAGAVKVVSALNTEMKRQFGSNAPTFEYDSATKKISLKASVLGDEVSVSANGEQGSAALVSALGLTSGESNAVDASAKISELSGVTISGGTITVGSNTVTVDSNTTVQDLIDAGMTFSDKGVLSASAALTATGDGQTVLEALFKTDYTTLVTKSASLPTSGTAQTFTGKNATVTINGVTISNASNIVTIDGTSINLSGLTEAEADAVSDTNPITITTSRDTSAVKDVVLKFVEDYNKLISELNTEITTKRPTSGGSKYEPLTEEQREEMSDDQIEDWEEKAKTGLLYNDQEVFTFLSKLRSAMNTQTSSGFSLSTMGINISSTYSDKGKLVINDTAKFEAAFDKYADEIQELFTTTDTGLAAKVTGALDSASSTSRTTGYGSLVRKAGVANTVSGTDNELTSKIEQYQEIISQLQERYSDELDRYWSKFTALETMMAKYSSYSSMFTSST